MSQSKLPQPSLRIVLSRIFRTVYFWVTSLKLSVSHAFETCLFSCPWLNTPYSCYTYGQINPSKNSWKNQACYASTHHLCTSHAQKSKKNLGWLGYVENIQSKLLFKAKSAIKVAALQLLQCSGPWPVQACTPVVMQILQNFRATFSCA